jgi:hypothetical protein
MGAGLAGRIEPSVLTVRIMSSIYRGGWCAGRCWNVQRLWESGVFEVGMGVEIFILGFAGVRGPVLKCAATVGGGSCAEWRAKPRSDRWGVLREMGFGVGGRLKSVVDAAECSLSEIRML